MKLEDVSWHDSVVVRVVESPTKIVAFQVEYPEDWEREVYENKTILFRDIYCYEIHEGPFQGPITILSASEEPGPHDTRCLRLETNAGYRLLQFKTLELAAGHTSD